MEDLEACVTAPDFRLRMCSDGNPQQVWTFEDSTGLLRLGKLLPKHPDDKDDSECVTALKGSTKMALARCADLRATEHWQWAGYAEEAAGLA
jgi:hypothetical protein